MAYAFKRPNKGKPSYTGMFVDPDGVKRSAGTFSTKRDAERAAHREEQRVREGRWHESQVVEAQPGGAVLLTVRVAGWEEMRRWILGFGVAAEVLEPEELRASLKREAAGLARLYGRRTRVPPSRD